MKRFSVFLLCILFLIVLLSGAACANDESVIIGTWKCQTSVLGIVTETVFQFNEDGSGYYSRILGVKVAFTYEFTENVGELIFRSDIFGASSEELYEYHLTMDTLTLTDSKGEVTSLTRVPD